MIFSCGCLKLFNNTTNGRMLLRFSITCEPCSSQRIMQNLFYAPVNHVADLSGHKCDISERSTGHTPGS